MAGIHTSKLPGATEALTINGMKCGGTGGYQIGCYALSLFAADNSAGITVYFYEGDTLSRSAAGYIRNGTIQEGFALRYLFTARTRGYCWWNNTGSGDVSYTPAALGYVSLNRTAANLVKLFHASSVSPHAEKASSAVVSGETRQNLEIGYHCYNNAGVFTGASDARHSFFALQEGLTVTESQSFYNAIQAYRVALGGGFK